MDKEKTLHLSSHENDTFASKRKQDHIELAFQSRVGHEDIDKRFYYEPLLASHPDKNSLLPFTFLGKKFRTPVWVSSMTGGTEKAHTINHNLARACKDFGMGMGLGSCRGLLDSDEYLKDFDVRQLIGDDLPLYSNLGIAQVEQLVQQNKLHKVEELIDKLRADGLIVHVNPLQEWLQPEGDRLQYSPLETIKRLLEKTDIPIIVKEVGQGMGYESLKQLFQLPLQAIEFAAYGGTNFSRLELLRNKPVRQQIYGQLAFVGHTAEEMMEFSNQLISELGEKRKVQEVIISGGVRSFLDGYYLINKLALSCVYGQASAFLKHARGNYEELFKYVSAQVEGLELANAFLKVR
ncbi:MAG: type 2 isopentenyl-diphosphate Delta-isomerase [Bacteroidetes bacterium]|nr:type 2 isopentenyl-diphosphate Delta-isomerase [Bacteroidota bacterium]